MAKKTIRIQYDCARCPGYCCSYPRIEVSKGDIARLAKHFGLSEVQSAKKFTRQYRSDGEVETVLRHRKDEIYGSICRFFDTDARRCTVYQA
ncbi:MAG: YkgJ family cysteine cluster protein, partial [Quisquiliibacterium sp.]